ncbi:MAG: hypothetical protein H0W50_05315 [Parachlamydiaceae bacterium]|nr:hypothetical protein [Parachlamydiaceae bacterium]
MLQPTTQKSSTVYVDQKNFQANKQADLSNTQKNNQTSSIAQERIISTRRDPMGPRGNAILKQNQLDRYKPIKKNAPISKPLDGEKKEIAHASHNKIVDLSSLNFSDKEKFIDSLCAEATPCKKNCFSTENVEIKPVDDSVISCIEHVAKVSICNNKKSIEIFSNERRVEIISSSNNFNSNYRKEIVSDSKANHVPNFNPKNNQISSSNSRIDTNNKPYNHRNFERQRYNFSENGGWSGSTSFPPYAVEVSSDFIKKFRFSQKSINSTTTDFRGRTQMISDLKDDMWYNGFNKKYALEIVLMSDNIFTSRDNRRAYCAKLLANKNPFEIYVKIHHANDEAPKDLISSSRYSFYKDFGRDFNSLSGGVKAGTWGELIQIRVNGDHRHNPKEDEQNGYVEFPTINK